MNATERARLEASFTKCRCGNTARRGELTCARCEHEDRQKESTADAISEAHTALANTLYEAGVAEYHSVAEAISDLIDAKIAASKIG
jgi:hypothetical protein